MQSLIRVPDRNPRLVTPLNSSNAEEGATVGGERVVGPPAMDESSRGPLLPPRDIVLAGLSLYTGLMGSLAFVIASVQDINLWSMFDWSSQDVPVSLAYLIPLQIINAIIMVPDYSSWSLPKPKMPEQDIKVSAMDPDPIFDLSTLDLSSSARLVEDKATTSSLPSPMSAASWGKPRSSKAAKTLKDALFIAQSHYAANNPTAGLNLGLEILSATLSSLSTELLYRGVSITILASWINDRLYEAGCDDFISLPSCVLFLIGHSEGSLMSLDPLPIGTYEAARWSAALALVGLSVTLVLRKLIAQSSRKAIVIQVLGGDESASEGGGKAGPRGKKATAAAQPKIKPLPLFQDTIAAANVIQGARNVSQTLCLNFIFAATGGNLAATYAASMVNQAIFSVMQSHSSQRTRKRSIELAAELQDFNAKLREIQVRAEEKLQVKLSMAKEADAVLAQAKGDYFRNYLNEQSVNPAQPPPAIASSTQGPSNDVHRSDNDKELAAEPETGMRKTLASLDLLLPQDPVSKH